MRRSLCIRPALCLMLTCLLLLPCAGCGGKTDPFQSYFSEKPFVEFLTEEDTDTLRAQYPEEFQWLDVMLGPVTLFREDALELVTDQAIEDSGSGFAQIPGAAYALAFERAAQDFNAEQAAKAENAKHGFLGLRAKPHQLEVRDRTAEALLSCRPLKGAEGPHASSGGHASGTVTVGCEAGETISGCTVDTTVRPVTLEYTADGPVDTVQITPKVRASHGWAFGLLYGSLAHVEYDLYNVSAGEVEARVARNVILCPEVRVASLWLRITGMGEAYILHADGAHHSYFRYFPEGIDAVCACPSAYF